MARIALSASQLDIDVYTCLSLAVLVRSGPAVASDCTRRKPGFEHRRRDASATGRVPTGCLTPQLGF